MRRVATAHPDAGGDVADAARLNDAYQALLDPLLRSAALLQARHAPSSDERALPAGFLLEMMELRERLDAACGDESVLRELKEEGVRLKDCAIADIARAFNEGDNGSVLTPDATHQVWLGMNVLRAAQRMLEQLDRGAGESAR